MALLARLADTTQRTVQATRRSVAAMMALEQVRARLTPTAPYACQRIDPVRANGPEVGEWVTIGRSTLRILRASNGAPATRVPRAVRSTTIGALHSPSIAQTDSGSVMPAARAALHASSPHGSV